MNYEYSENILVQESSGKVLKDKLGWDVVFAYNTEALKVLGAFTSSATLMQINEEKYFMLRDGIPVLYKNADGSTELRLAKVFNFDKPEKNHFLAVKEMKIHGELYCRFCKWYSTAIH